MFNCSIEIKTKKRNLFDEKQIKTVTAAKEFDKAKQYIDAIADIADVVLESLGKPATAKFILDAIDISECLINYVTYDKQVLSDNSSTKYWQTNKTVYYY